MSSSLIGKRLGRYEIRSEIGRGGMGMVFEAFDALLQRTVAIKVLPPQFAFDEDFVRRFHREGVMSAQLHHVNVVTIHDVGEHDGFHYLVMEFLEGKTLDQWLKDHGTMPLSQAVPVLRQIASALDFAHSRGMIHRDIKPSNIMLTAEGHATLMDFGLVRAAEGAMLTRTGMVVGTPEYMAPEQATGAEVDARTDVYALGVVLYRMLSGKLPFTRSTPYAVTYAHIHEPPPPLRQTRADLPPRLEAILLKALAKDPAARYQRAGHLADDFAAAVAELPAAVRTTVPTA
ncbi:MAG: serine/threonine-protein kinase, partial [Anaerolineae bacterium]